MSNPRNQPVRDILDRYTKSAEKSTGIVLHQKDNEDEETIKISVGFTAMDIVQKEIDILSRKMVVMDKEVIKVIDGLITKCLEKAVNKSKKISSAKRYVEFSFESAKNGLSEKYRDFYRAISDREQIRIVRRIKKQYEKRGFTVIHRGKLLNVSWEEVFQSKLSKDLFKEKSDDEDEDDGYETQDDIQSEIEVESIAGEDEESDEEKVNQPTILRPPARGSFYQNKQHN